MLDRNECICYDLPRAGEKNGICTRSLMDRTVASDASDAGSIPVGCSKKIKRSRAHEALENNAFSRTFLLYIT